MKRRLSALLLALLFTLTACAPSSGSQQDDGRITLSVVGKKSDMERIYTQRILQLYERSCSRARRAQRAA